MCTGHIYSEMAVAASTTSVDAASACDRQIDMLDCGLSDVYWFPKPVGDEL